MHRPNLPTLLGLACAFALGGAQAQSAAPVTPAPAAKHAPSAKTAAPAKTSKAAKAAPPREVPLAPATPEQLEAANIALLGDYDCEFDQRVTLEPSPKAAGYVEMRFKSQTWVMKPVLSSTGALRLEDVKSRMLMIQIANKSMVMDTQLGQRVVDSCIHEKQRGFIATQPNLLSPDPAKP